MLVRTWGLVSTRPGGFPEFSRIHGNQAGNLITDIQNILVSRDQHVSPSLECCGYYKPVIWVPDDLEHIGDGHVAHNLVETKFFNEIGYKGARDTETLREHALKLTQNVL